MYISFKFELEKEYIRAGVAGIYLQREAAIAAKRASIEGRMFSPVLAETSKSVSLNFSARAFAFSEETSRELFSSL